jgi:N-acetylglutamate synthase-like GNAT family acetyltransferase
MSHALSPPATDADWQAFHDIRDDVLFRGRHRTVGYDRNHPDDHNPANEPLLLKAGGRPVGVVRLDDRGDGTGVVRLVAVVKDTQGSGHGRVMSELWDERARSRGFHTLYVNAAPEAVGYYDKMGWERFVWDPDELVSIAADCIQMRKRL